MAESAGMMDEHEPRNTEHSGSGDYVPTPEEDKAIKLVNRLFEKAKKFRSQYDDRWLDYYRMFRGAQWKEQRPSYRHSEVINLVFRTLQSLIPIQVDTRPRFEFLPQEPADLELSQILNEVAEADWSSKNWGEQLLEVVYDSNIYGTGLSKMVVKEILGKLELIFESADPFYCFPDPDARDVNKDCGYFVYAEPRDVRKVKKDYPDKKEYIKADLNDLLRGSKTDFAPMRFRSPVDNKVVVEGAPTQELIDKERALQITCWMSPEFCEDEYEEVPVPGVDPETGMETQLFEKRAKYPLGRKIVLCNGVLLEDVPAGYDDGEIPYQRYFNYLLPREFWGQSEIEQLEGPQKIFNKLVNFVLDVLTLMGNPIWKVHGTNGIDTDNLVNRPGLIVEWDGDHEPKREEGVQLQPYVMTMIDKMAEWFDSIGGSQDITRGVQPTGVTAATAINTLQEAAHTRIRQKARNMDYYLQNVGKQWLSRTFQFRTAPEVYRLTGNNGAQKYFKMHVEQYDKPDGSKGTKVHVQKYGPTGGIDPMGAKVYEVRGKFDVRVATGSSLPFAKSEKEQKLLSYFDRGIIDEEEVLRGSEFPNWEAVLQRVEEKKRLAAEQQAMAQGGAPA